MKMSIFVCMTLVLAFACVQGMNLREGEGDLKKHKHKYGDWEIPNDDKRMYNGEGDLKKGPHKHKHGEGEGPIEVEDVDRRMGGRPHGPPPVLDAEFFKDRATGLCDHLLTFVQDEALDARLVRALAKLMRRQGEVDLKFDALVDFCTEFNAPEEVDGA